jgi:hypothetical protein
MKDTEPTYLHLTENFRLFRCDDRNFEVEQNKEVVAHPNRYIKELTISNKWVSIGYFSTLSQAITKVLFAHEEELSTKDKITLQDVLIELKEIKDDLVKKVNESGIKVTDFVKTVDGRGRKSGVTVAKVTKSVDETQSDETMRSKNQTKTPIKRGRGRPPKVKVV